MRQFIILIVLSFPMLLSGQTLEKTYLRTDKDLYAPGDTLWFKGYVFNRYNTLQDQGLKLNVFLNNEAGEKLYDGSWPIYSGMTNGYIPIPEDEGRYFLVAYTPDMMNLDVSYSFRKEIFVRSAIAADIDVAVTYDNAEDTPGKIITSQIEVSNANRPLTNERFKYQYYVNGEVVKKGRIKTDEQGHAEITDLLAPDEGRQAYLLFEMNQDDSPLPFRFKAPLKGVTKKIDLQFFPEGGKIIKDINGKIAFKAIDPGGQPFDFTGLLMDNAGKVIDTVRSYYQGMGAFFLRPKQESYRFKIIEPVGIDSLYQLPPVANQGSALSLQFSEKDTLIKISSSKEMTGKALEMRLQQHGITLFSQPTKGTPIEFIRLPKEQLDIGIATLSLLTEDGQIISERLFFTGSQDQLDIDIALDKAEYLPRNLVKLKLKVTDTYGNPVQGNFSLAAVDDTYAPNLRPYFPNLMAQILLQSDLKGKIPTPNFYFTDHEKASKALDLVMLTHGWRDYKMITQIAYENITGQLVNSKKKKKKLGNTEISIFDLVNFSESIVTADAEGRFSIPPSHFKYKGDSFLVAAKARNEKEKPLIRLSNDHKISHRAYKKAISEEHSSLGKPDHSIYLKENKVGFDRFRNAIILNSVSVFGKGMGGCELTPDKFENPWKTKMRSELDLTDLDPLTMLRQVSKNVKGFGNVTAWVDGVFTLVLQDQLLSHMQIYARQETPYGRRTSYYPLSYLVYVNCESVGAFGPNTNMSYALGSLDFSNVYSISVMDPQYDNNILTDRIIGFVMINTIDEKVVYRPFSRQFFTYALKTEQEAQFYAPMYDTKEKRDLEIPDLRTTIHWEHSIITNEQGEATIQFYNADRDNRIRVTVEGLGQMQRFGFAQKDYRVLMPAAENNR